MRDPKGPVKPYRSPEEIAKKHKVPLEKIMKQVRMGTKVEGEHTTSKSGAKITALQHVDELPDYYTKLKKVEKKKSMKESLETAKMGLEGKRYCRLCRKEETQQECSFGPDMWNRFSIATVHPTNEEFLGEKKGLWDNIHARRKKGLPPKKPGEKGYPKTLDIDEDHKEIVSGKKKDEEGYMANVEFDQIERAVNILRKKITKGNQQIPAWVQSKITRAADFIDTAADYISSDETVSEDLKQARKNVGASKCWPGKVAKGTKMKGGIEVPNCKPAEDTCMSFSQFMQLAEASPAWQRKEGKNPTGGLNAKGRASAKAQGHNLKPPVTTPPSELNPDSKAAKRRKSFCARMGGMPGPMKDEKGRPTRKALSLRKWNC